MGGIFSLQGAQIKGSWLLMALWVGRERKAWSVKALSQCGGKCLSQGFLHGEGSSWGPQPPVWKRPLKKAHVLLRKNNLQLLDVTFCNYLDKWINNMIQMACIFTDFLSTCTNCWKGNVQISTTNVVLLISFLHSVSFFYMHFEAL